MATTNPITQVYEAIWTLLLARSDVADNVKAGNRIDLTGDNRDPLKQSGGMGADLPEIMVTSRSIGLWDHRTSGNTTFTKEFAIRVKTDSQLLADPNYEATGLFDLEFAIIRAMTNWVDTMTALTWNDKTFVQRCELRDGEESIADDRAYKGWQVLWRGEVEFWFLTADLTAA